MSSYLIASLVLFAFGLTFAVVVTGWRDAINERAEPAVREVADAPFITAIIPARNEESNITAVLQDLYAQSYPRERMEVIVVDDETTDRTTALVQAMIPRWPQLLLLKNDGIGKKAAITTGVNAGTSDLVILTDADVRFGPERIPSIVAHWQAERSAMIVLPVLTEGHGLLGRLQEEEQAALLGMAMGSVGQGNAALAYGANLAFTREAFLAVGGYAGDRFASGDDLFLLQRIVRSGRRVTGLFDPKVLATAAAVPTFSAFAQQRLRWAGKMRGAGAGVFLTGLVALLFPWALLWQTLCFELPGSIGDHAIFNLALLLGAWACWSFPALALVRDVRKSFARPHSGLGTVIGLMAFSLYAPLLAIAALLVSPKWKGRPI